MDYEQLKIKSYKHWDLYLHENQCYLGRTFLQLKGGSVGLITEIIPFVFTSHPLKMQLPKEYFSLKKWKPILPMLIGCIFTGAAAYLMQRDLRCKKTK